MRIAGGIIYWQIPAFLDVNFPGTTRSDPPRGGRSFSVKAYPDSGKRGP